MANTSPTVDSVPVLKDNLSRASKEKIRIFQAASISCNLKGQEETDMDALKEAGACGFTDDGIPLLNAEFCFHAMEKAASLTYRSAFTKKILLSSATTESATERYPMRLASTVLLPLQKNLWLQETACWH